MGCTGVSESEKKELSEKFGCDGYRLEEMEEKWETKKFEGKYIVKIEKRNVETNEFEIEFRGQDLIFFIDGEEYVVEQLGNGKCEIEGRIFDCENLQKPTSFEYTCVTQDQKHQNKGHCYSIGYEYVAKNDINMVRKQLICFDDEKITFYGNYPLEDNEKKKFEGLGDKIYKSLSWEDDFIYTISSN
jgi:hypothetical protein